jgi:heat shock protein HtpX
MATPTIAIPPRRSMVVFAASAILMTIFSYLFLLAVAVASVYLPFLLLESGTGGLQVLLLLLFGIAVAGALIWSMVPRRDKFTPPGPILERASQPRLFAELDRIAGALGQPVPHDVYLIGDMNAYVADRGGIMGFDSHRIMGLGLPLLSLLTISQFRAVLAHEFAHFYGGDTRLGPWVYKARKSMIQTFENVGSLRGLVRTAIIQLMYLVVFTILKWYFLAFLRITSLISRRQEFRADELACLVAGPSPLINGLRTIHSAGPAWPVYWNTEVSPLLSDGTIPGIGDGFARFVAAPDIARQIDAILAKQLEAEKVKPYDTHPPLRERIQAAEELSATGEDSETLPASSLLDNLDTLELSLVRTVNPKLAKTSLMQVNWDEVVEKATIPSWTTQVNQYFRLLDNATVGSLPDAISKTAQMGPQIRDPQGTLLNPQQRMARAADLLAMALGLALYRQGWTLCFQPGEKYLQRESFRINPFEMVRQLADKEMTQEAWQTLCQNLGIGQLSLVPAEAVSDAPEIPPASPSQNSSK